MSFRISPRLKEIIKFSDEEITINEEGSLFSKVQEISERIEDLEFISDFKVSQRLLFEYLIGKKELRIFSLKGKRKRLQKGRIIGSKGVTIRGLARRTKTKIYTLRYKFLIFGCPVSSLKAFEVLKKIGSGRSYECSFRGL